MFRTNLCALHEPEALALFPHIRFHNIGDATIVAAILMLYGDRVDEDHPLCVEAVGYPAPMNPNTIRFQYMVDKPENKGKNVKHVSVLQRYKVDVDAFSNEEIKSGLCCIHSASYHYSIVLLPQLTPWFFKDKPLTDWEKSMVLSGLKDNAEEFNRYIQEYIERINLQKRLKDAKLKLFVQNLLENKLSSYKKEEQSLLQQIAETEARLNTLAAHLNEVNAFLVGTKQSHRDDNIQQFVDMIHNNPNIHIDSCERGTITLVVTGFLTNFKKDKYVSTSSELGSVMYQSLGYNGVANKVMKLVYDEMILGRRYRLNLGGKFRLDFVGGTVTLIKTNSNRLTDHCIPNPHIAHWTCAGGFGAMYREAFSNADYMDLLDIMFSEVQNINFTDYSPVKSWTNDLCSSYWRSPVVFDSVENTFITPEQLCKRLEAKNE